MSELAGQVIKPILHHVTFKTTRLQEMIDWYTKVVGINVNFQFPGGAWTSNDRANHRLSFLAVPGLKEDSNKISHSGMHHTAFEYGSFGDLMTSYARLKALGIEPDVCLNHGLTISLYYVDPDSNLVELQVDSYGDWDKSSEFMRSAPEFAANPIGAFFDPDLMFTAHQAGQSFEQIHQDSYAGRFPPTKAPNLHLPPMP